MLQLGSELWFPPPEHYGDDGLVAIGGDLSPDRLLLAYERGIFPWSAPEDPLLWWCPEPRAILPPAQIKVSKSMRNVLNRGEYKTTFDQDFRGVMEGCAHRPDEGTWITEDFVEAYAQLHALGFAHSVETWNQEGELVGGLYGVSLGSMFFGESMFARSSNASKVAFVQLARQLEQWGMECIDCQIMNPHLKTLGATHVPRAIFLDTLKHCMNAPTKRGTWAFDSAS